MSRLSLYADPLVPERVGPTEANGVGIAPTDLHIALVVETLDDWNRIKKVAYLIQPPLWDGTVKLHVVLRHPKATAEEMALRVAAVDTGIADPRVAGLTAPDQIDLGWPEDRDA